MSAVAFTVTSQTAPVVATSHCRDHGVCQSIQKAAVNILVYFEVGDQEVAA
jgi:hypothetical protein